MATKKGKASSKGSAASKKGGGSKGSSKGTSKAAAGKGSAASKKGGGGGKGSKKSGGKTSAKSSAKKSSLGSTAAWTGTPTTINQNQNLQISQTPNGTLIFSYFNQSTTTNAGKLVVSSGAGQPTTLQVPAGVNQPGLLVNNWGGNNLSVSNTSVTPTPILVEAVGPGLPGLTPTKLPMDGTALPLAPYGSATGFAAAQGNAPAQFVNVSLQCNTSKLTILAIQVGNNVWVIALNDPVGESGPNSGSPSTAPPPGYYATTSTNNYQGAWNWGGASVYIVNLSPGTSIPAQVSLLPI
jgi:hypothetical protein